MKIIKKFYKASNDAAFKSIFCKKNNRDLLKRLLETSMEKEVEIESIANAEILKNNLAIRNKTLDAIVKAGKELYLVEMNSSTYNGLNRRNAAFAFSKYSEETKVGDKYTNMRTIIQLNFTRGLPKSYPLVCKYELTDIDSGLKYIDNLIIYEFNVDKIFDKCYNEGEEKYKFIALLAADKKQLHKLCKGDDIMSKFEEELNKLNEDTEFISFMSAEEDAEKVRNTLLANAREEGVEQGILNKSLEIARNLIDLGISTQDIIKATGLSEQEIIALKQELN